MIFPGPVPTSTWMACSAREFVALPSFHVPSPPKVSSGLWSPGSLGTFDAVADPSLRNVTCAPCGPVQVPTTSPGSALPGVHPTNRLM
ncbi:hypothetical protein [Streptomyces sp. WAC 06725]|uniref:hypothetical protein n=1 Tax=Streptomyces sp. WAC 06725 TaxID=2203209 RepID=UPI000F73BE6D|nr:hypothetical protein [Streptomyces sp. WAC 06725]